MSTATQTWRANIMDAALAPTHPTAKKRKPRAIVDKYDDFTPTQQPRLSPIKASVSPAAGTAPRGASRESLLVGAGLHGYTLHHTDLQPGMRVDQWPGLRTQRTVAGTQRLTKDASEVTYTDGTTSVAGAGARFAHKS